MTKHLTCTMSLSAYLPRDERRTVSPSSSSMAANKIGWNKTTATCLNSLSLSIQIMLHLQSSACFRVLLRLENEDDECFACDKICVYCHMCTSIYALAYICIDLHKRTYNYNSVQTKMVRHMVSLLKQD